MKAKEDRSNSQDWSVCLEQDFQIDLGAAQKKVSQNMLLNL